MKHRVAILSAIFAIFLLLPFSTPKANAAWFLSDPNSFGQTLQNAETSNQVQKEGYDMSTQVNMMNSMSCLIVGCSNNPTSSLHYSKSAIAGVGNYLAAMYSNPPADTVAFVQDMGQNLGFMPKAYAQGVGFSGLAPLLGLWKAFRNIAYILLALVMVVIGFMVMFRKKIDPKTVVTVQNALPRIVITLLLITFSYAIVGLLIDLMYLIILLAVAVIGGSGIQGVDIPFLQNLYTSGNFGEMVGRVFSSLNIFGAGTAITGAIPVVSTVIGGIVGGGPIGALVGGFLGTIGAAVIGGVTNQPGGALAPLLYLFFALALFFGVIRILFMLVMAYIQIILAVVIGPIQILLEAVPGTNGFMSWLTNLIANLAAFPITAVLLLIGDVIGQNVKKGGTLWQPPFIPGGTGDLVIAIIGVGITLSIPGVYNSLKKSLKIQPAPVSFGAGVGGTAMQMISYGVSIKQLGQGWLWGKPQKEKP